MMDMQPPIRDIDIAIVKVSSVLMLAWLTLSVYHTYSRLRITFHRKSRLQRIWSVGMLTIRVLIILPFAFVFLGSLIWKSDFSFFIDTAFQRKGRFSSWIY